VRDPEPVDAPAPAETPTPNWIRQRTLAQAMFPPETGEPARGDHFGLKSLQLFTVAGGVKRKVDLLLNLAKKRVDACALDLVEPIAGDLSGSCVYGVYDTVKVGSDQAGADRFDDSFVPDP